MTEGLELVMGDAKFTGPKSAEVRLNDGNVSHLTGETIFINTGLRPTKPPIPGLDSVPTLDNASIMELDTLPEHLLVLGGGYIALEFAQMFRRFGCEVTFLLSTSSSISWKETSTPSRPLMIQPSTCTQRRELQMRTHRMVLRGDPTRLGAFLRLMDSGTGSLAREKSRS